MAVKTYAEQLEEVQTAIAKAESEAQEWRQGERSERQADLDTLYKREKWLRTMVARQSRGGMRVRRGVVID